MTDDKSLGLVDEWPKRCSCGRVYNEHEWSLLRFIGSLSDDVASLELRNCLGCNSTLAVEIESE